MARTLILRPGDLGDSGLWSPDGRGRPIPLDPDATGLSDDLCDAIEAWLDQFDAAQDADQPGKVRFASQAERLAWLAEGEALAAAAQAELGESWQVMADLDTWRAP
jgi:hypothetical protein